MCGCGKSKIAVTSVQLEQQAQAEREQQDPAASTTALMRERRALQAAIANSRG